MKSIDADELWIDKLELQRLLDEGLADIREKRTEPLDTVFADLELFAINSTDVRKNFTAEKFIEADGSVTLSLNEMDIIENGKSENEAKQALAQSILDYSEDFYKDFSYWGSAPNRKAHIPYVFKALALDDIEKIGELIICQGGNKF